MRLITKNLKLFYCFTFFMNLFVGMLMLGVPLIALMLGANNLTLGVIGTLGAFVYILFVPVAGGISNHLAKNFQAGLGAIIFGAMVSLIPFMPRLAFLYPLVVIYFLALALVWPALESALCHYVSGRELSRSAGWYNVSWCSGAMIGIYIAGWVYGIKPNMVFFSAGALAVLMGVCFMIFFRVPEQPISDDKEEKRSEVYFLYLSWLANGMAYFSMNQIRNIFPKLAMDLSISSSNLGFLLMILNLSQGLMFIILNFTVRWHYRITPIVLAMFSNFLGLILVSFTDKMLGFSAGFFLLGAGAGMSYSASLYYAISLSSSLAGERSGWHEFYLGLGALLGPLLGGILAQYVGSRSPYLFSAFLVLVMMTGMILYYRRVASSAFEDES